MTQSLNELCTSLLEGAGPVDSVLFRVDAGRIPGLSFGHLSRCIILSHALRRRGIHTALLMRDIAEGTDYARSQGETVHILSPQSLQLTAPQVLIVDLPYDAEQPLLEDARARNLWLVYLDDTGRSHIRADVVLNSNILASPDMYPEVQRRLLGPSHFFLMDEDRALIGQPRYRTSRSTSAAPDNILQKIAMTFGGSDPTGLTFKTLTALIQARLPIHLDIVLGPGFASIYEIRELAAQIAARVLIAPPRLLPILHAADLVICAGGRTLYECSALGLPVLAIASTNAEAKSIRAFADSKLILGGLETWNSESFINILSTICLPPP